MCNDCIGSVTYFETFLNDLFFNMNIICSSSDVCIYAVLLVAVLVFVSLLSLRILGSVCVGPAVWGCGLSGNRQTQRRSPQTPRLWFKNHIQTDIIIRLYLTHWRLWTCLSLTHTDPLFISLNRHWPRLGSNKGVGFTSGIRGAVQPCRPLHCLFALETQTLWNSHSEALHKYWGYLQRWF